MRTAHGKYWKKHKLFSIYYAMNITMEELIRIIREELTTFAGGKGHLSYLGGKLPVDDTPPEKDYPNPDVVAAMIGDKEYSIPDEETKEPESDPEPKAKIVYKIKTV